MTSFTPNVFDLLGDEGDDRPRRQAKAAKPAATTAAPTTTASKPAQPTPAQQQKSAAAKPAAAPAKKDNEGKGPRPQGDAPKGRPNNANRPPAHRQQGSGAVSNYESEKAPRKDKRDSREGRERPPQRGRQFDRRSGTGRAPTENKKSGSGKGNWGKDGEEVKDVEGAPVAEAEEKVEAPVGENEAAPEGVEVEPPKEPEKEVLSYEEYLANLKEKGKAVKGVEAPKLRAAGEGVDQSAWANYAPLEKDDEENALVKKKAQAPKKEGAKAEEKVEVEKFFRVTMPRPQSDDRRDRGERRDRGDRGERRGGDRGGRGDRRGGKSPKGPRTAPQAESRTQANGHAFADTDFPALAGSGGVAHPTPAASTPAPTQQQAPAPVKA